jgi:WD40 repeat protein
MGVGTHSQFLTKTNILLNTYKLIRNISALRKLWESQNLEIYVLTVSWSPDGRKIAVCGKPGMIAVLDNNGDVV